MKKQSDTTEGSTRKAKLPDYPINGASIQARQAERVESEGRHTPTPWSWNTEIKEFVPKEQGGGEKVRLYAAGNTRIGSLNIKDLHAAKANAAFIVRAVNNFDQMLLALKRLQDKTVPHSHAHQIASEAIAKAEGKGA